MPKLINIFSIYMVMRVETLNKVLSEGTQYFLIAPSASLNSKEYFCTTEGTSQWHRKLLYCRNYFPMIQGTSTAKMNSLWHKVLPIYSNYFPLAEINSLQLKSKNISLQQGFFLYYTEYFPMILPNSIQYFPMAQSTSLKQSTSMQHRILPKCDFTGSSNLVTASF